MGTIKRRTTYVTTQMIPAGYPSWEVPPTLKTAVDCLNSYSHWVSMTVMPIAFQWIEEHHEEVYANLSESEKWDVGVVIATAFDLVKQTPYYERGLQEAAKIKAEKSEGSFDPSRLNPTWTKIADEVQADIKRIFNEHGLPLAENPVDEPMETYAE